MRDRTDRPPTRLSVHYPAFPPPARLRAHANVHTRADWPAHAHAHAEACPYARFLAHTDMQARAEERRRTAAPAHSAQKHSLV